VLGIYFLSIIVIMILASILYYLIKKPAEPLYFVADKAGRLIQDIPVQVPNMPLDDVIAWTIEAVQSAYSFNVLNYREQLQSAEKYFTDYGWRTYMDGLRAANNLTAVEQRKLIIVAKVVGKPKVLVQGRMSGAYAWKFQIPLLVTYSYPPYDDKSQFQNPLSLTVIVQRQPLLSSDRGLGIVQMIGNIVNSPQTQNLSATPAS